MSKSFVKLAAQGDLMLRRIDAIDWPADECITISSANLVVAHSETGHHHTVMPRLDGAVALLTRPSGDSEEMISALTVPAGGADLVHHRSYDTHETIALDEGLYEVRRQREYTPEGWRRVED